MKTWSANESFFDNLNNDKQIKSKLSTDELKKLFIALCKQATYRNAGDEALALAESAKEIYDSLGGIAANADLAEAYTGIGYSLKQLNRTAEAARTLEKAVEIHRQDHFPFVDDLLRTQAIWYSELGDWESTLRCHLEAVTVNEVDGNQEWLAKSLFNVGVAYGHLNNFPEAILKYKQARDIFKELKMVVAVGMCDENISEAYVELNNGELALEAAKRALDVARTADNQTRIMCSSYNLGKAQVLLNDFEQAESSLASAHFLAQSNENIDFKFLVGVEEEEANLMRLTNRVTAADEIERRLTTIREILG
jgi:tetratricopeptide (TPR) repeat protein